MNRITNMKAIRRGSAAAIVAALVVSGAGIAGASANSEKANTRALTASTMSARSANHDHGAKHAHEVEGMIASITGTTMVVTTHGAKTVTVTLVPSGSTGATVVTMDHTKLALTNLAPGERVSVTPAKGSTMTSYTAAAIRVKPTRIHPVEGMITSITDTTMVVTTHGAKTVTVTMVPSGSTGATVVTMDHTTLALTNLAVGERVNIAPASTSTTTSFVAASVKIQSTKVHPVEGTFQGFTPTSGAPASMTITTSKNQTVTVFFGPESAVVNGPTVSQVTATSLSVGEHVHVTLVAGTTPMTPVALLVTVQPQS